MDPILLIVLVLSGTGLFRLLDAADSTIVALLVGGMAIALVLAR